MTIGIEALVGQTIGCIQHLLEKSDHNSDREIEILRFITEENEIYDMYYDTYLCDIDIFLEEIIGDLQDLINSPIIKAEENCSESWTFYNLASTKGSVALKWYSSSTGYYSEKVNFELKGKLKNHWE